MRNAAGMRDAATLGAMDQFPDVAEAWQRLVNSGAATSLLQIAPARWATAMDEMLEAQRRLSQEGRWSAGPASLMEVLEIERNEVLNCKVIRWLLDPIARHGIGAALLRKLSAEVEFSIGDTTACSVDTEVSREATRADIVVNSAGGEVLVVEAKIDAGEQPQQAARLESQWPEASRFVFITPNGVRLPATLTDADRWRSLSWDWFADQAVQLLDSRPTEDPVVNLSHSSIRSWAHTIRRNYR